MRLVLIAAVLAAGPAFAGDLVARIEGNSVRLTNGSCPVSVLQQIPEGLRGYFRKASVLYEGKGYVACWAPRTDGQVHLVYADGDSGLIPLELFDQEPDA